MSEEPVLVPLTKGQQSIWYMDQVESQNAHYNIAAAITLTPKIDHSRMEKTFNTLIDRHEVLRSKIEVREGKVFQSILPSAQINITEHDASKIDDSQIKAELKRKSQQRFQLDKEIPFRVEVYQKTTHSIMYFCIHHIFSDFWSIALLIDEIMLVYTALELGEVIELPPVTLSYSQYCQSSIDWLESKQARNAKTYWLDKLDELVPELSLSDNLMENTGRQGRHLRFKLSKKETSIIFQQAQAYHCTAFSVLLAYYFKLLNWISGEKDIIVGIPVLGRSKAAEKLTVGYLVNPLPICCKSIGEKTVEQLAQQIHIDVRKIIALQRYPFAQIAKQFENKRRLDSTPIFQTMFSYQQAQKGTFDCLAALTVEDESVSFSNEILSIRSFSFEPDIAQFELSMVTAIVKEQLSIDLQYDANRLNEAKATSIASYFKELICSNPAIDDFPHDHSLTSVMQNVPDDSYKNIGTLIFERITQHPKNIAMRQYQRSINYDEFGKYCRLWMKLLNEQGFKTGDNVALILTQGFEQITASIAIILMGGFVAQLDSKSPIKRQQYCINKCNAKIVISKDHVSKEGSYSVVTLSDFEQQLLTFDEQLNFDTNLINTENGGALVFTSGSTGKPHCVVLSQKNLSSFTQDAIDTYQINASDVMMQFTSPGFDAFYEEVLPTLAVGATLVPKPSDLTTDSEQFEKFLSENKVSIVSLPTAFWHAWVSQISMNTPVYDDQSLPLLTRVIVGGEVMLIEKVSIWQTHKPDRIQLLNTYGPSEASVTATCYLVENASQGPLPIGRPLPNVKVMVLDDCKQPTATGQTGELYLSGPGLSSGYLNDAQTTAARFVVLSGTPGKWFASGDMVYQDSDRLLHYIARKDEQIKFHGVRIEPAEVEQLLCSLKSVSNVLAMLCGDKFIAFIESDVVIAKSEYVAVLKTHLIKEMIPSEFVHMNVFPQTSGGKVDRNSLREHYSSGPIITPDNPVAIAESNPELKPVSDSKLEVTLEALLSKWLNAKIAHSLSFFEQGMDSLSAVAIACSLSEHFKTKIPVRILFENPTLSSLSKALSETLSEASSNPKLPDYEYQSLTHSLDEKVDLTTSQKRILFIEKLLKEKQDLNICLAFKLVGELDPLKFNNDWNEEINAHEALKLVFTESEPFTQSIDHNCIHKLNYVTEIGELNLENIELTMSLVFETSLNKYFNSALVKLSPTQYLFFIKTHPLVCDIESLEILISSFQCRYNDSLKSVPKPSGYLNYARSTSGLPSALPFWKNYLKNSHGAPQLSIKRTQGKPSLSLATYRNSLGYDSTKQLNKFATQHHLTPAAVFFSGYYAVLAKNMTDTARFIIGTAVSHRGYGDHHNTVGPFTNFGLIGPDITLKNSFLNLLEKSQNSLIDAIEHQHIPIDALLQLLPKTSSGFPVECLFLYQSSPEKKLSFSEVKVTRISEKSSSLPALLCLEVTALENDFELVVTYDTGFYEQTCIKSFAESIKTLIINGLKNSALSLNQLNVIPAHLQRFCEGEVVEWQEKEQLLHTLFTSTARKHPLKTAIINHDQKISYGQLYRQSTRIARVIYAYRSKQCPLYVGIFMDKSWEQIVAALGVLRGGGTFAPISVNLSEQQVCDLLNNTYISVVITSTLYKKLYNWPEHVEVLTLDEPRVRRASVIPLRKKKVAVSKTDPAYIMFTSGTTGNPKGVVISHQAALNTIFDINHKIDLSSKDCIFALSNFNFDLSVYDIFGAFSLGAKVILPDHERLLEPSHWEELIIKHQVTIWNSVPALYRLMLDNLNEPFEGLRKVLLSGDFITLDLPELSSAKFPVAEIISLGGATEVSIWSVSFNVRDVPTSWSSIPYGLPLANQSCYVLDEWLNLCPPDVAGELYIGGAGVAIEYHHNQQASVIAFVYHQPSGKRLYKTGDAAKLSSKGYFEILGRLDKRIKIAGQFVDLNEVESALESIELITQCIVVGWSNKGESKRLAAFMLLAETAHMSLTPVTLYQKLVTDIYSSLSISLPRHMIPSKLVVLPEYPLTANGKIDRSCLEQYQGEFIAVNSGGTRPESPLQKVLANIWQSLLRCDDIRLEDNFFELGGDSLMVVSMLSDIEKELSVELPIQTFLLYQSIQELAPVISSILNNKVDKDSQPSIGDHLLQGELPEILQGEVHLDSSINNHRNETISDTSCNYLLLTGATGYLGSRILLAMLQSTNAEVFCLVRSVEGASELDRILNQVSKIQALTPEQESRVIPVKGDLSKPLLGLTEQDYNLLARQLDQIIHCGAQVNFLLPRRNLKAINVNGTVELLRLATRHKLKRFNYVSTVSVFPTIAKDLQKTFYENDDINQPLPIVGGYPQSKWIAEKIMLQARERGIPVNIFRPGVIFGDTRIKDLPTEVLLVDFLKICIDLKAVPTLDILIDIAPVDYVADAIVHISKSSKNSTFHLTNPQPIPLSDFIDVLINSGITLRKMPPLEWCKLLDKIDKTRASDGIKTMISMFENIESSGAIIFGKNLQHFDCSQTLSALKGASINCPPIDEKFIKYFYDELQGALLR
jgi:amino acid adenylation domain-containing protein/thioester reductase-like protein